MGAGFKLGPVCGSERHDCRHAGHFIESYSVDGGVAPVVVAAQILAAEALLLIFLPGIGCVIQYRFAYCLVAGEQESLRHGVDIHGAAHHSLSEAGRWGVDVFLGRLEIKAGRINLFQGLQYAFVVCGLPVRNQAAPHQAVGPVVERPLADVAVLGYYDGVRFPPDESIVLAGKNSVHDAVQSACSLVNKAAVIQHVAELEGSVDPVRALLKQPARAADHSVAVALAGTYVAPQPSVLEHLFVLVEVSGNAVRGILRPVFQPSFGLYLSQIQRDETLPGLRLAARDADHAQ